MPKRDFTKISIADFKHSTSIQIRFIDIDKMGHVNNATILSYFELARTVFFDEIIGETNSWFERGLIIANTNVDYLQPILLRDEVKAFVRIIKVGTKSFEVEHLLVKYKEGKEIICAIANSILVCMNYKSNQTIEIPAEWREKMLAAN
jgi:acyl-CoA thioester hydrolase